MSGSFVQMSAAQHWMPISLRQHDAVSVIDGDYPAAFADPFSLAAVQFARDGAHLLVLDTEHAGRDLLHAAAGLAATQVSLNRDQFLGLASAATELQSLSIEFISFPKLAIALKKATLWTRQKHVVALDLRAYSDVGLTSLEQTLILTALDNSIQRATAENLTVLIATNAPGIYLGSSHE